MSSRLCRRANDTARRNGATASATSPTGAAPVAMGTGGAVTTTGQPTTTLPQTGHARSGRTNIALFLALAAIAVVGVGFLLRRRAAHI